MLIKHHNERTVKTVSAAHVNTGCVYDCGLKRYRRDFDCINVLLVVTQSVLTDLFSPVLTDLSHWTANVFTLDEQVILLQLLSTCKHYDTHAL